jgi:hypothetical protein
LDLKLSLNQSSNVEFQIKIRSFESLSQNFIFLFLRSSNFGLDLKSLSNPLNQIKSSGQNSKDNFPVHYLLLAQITETSPTKSAQPATILAR